MTSSHLKSSERFHGFATWLWLYSCHVDGVPSLCANFPRLLVIISHCVCCAVLVVTIIAVVAAVEIDIRSVAQIM